MLASKTTDAILGLDIGTDIVGVALSDGTTVVPLSALRRAQGEAERSLTATIHERGIRLVVAGLPLDDNGSETSLCGSIRNFCRRLSKRIPTIDIAFIDESFSSVESEDRLGAGRRNRARLKQQGVIDSMSACVILERYLQQRDAR